VLSAGSVSYGKATSYLPVIDLLKAYFKVHDRETDRDIREKVTGKLLTLDRSLESVLPALLALLDVPMDDHSWQALDPEQRRRRTLDAVKGLLLRETQRQPLLVAFEDLHWIDSETQALLDALVGALPGARFLLLVNYRPEYQHGWGSKSYYTQLRLDTLASDTAEELLDTLLGMDSSVDPLKPLLIGRTAGNPLFLEESVRALVETASLTGDRGAYRLARPVEAIDVPATVQAILASRIDRLTPEHKHLLQTASVIGTNVSFALLAAVADVGDEDLQGGLAHLQAAEFLYETSLFPDPEYTFKHALTHDVAYGSLLQERRRALHARIVGAIEDLHAGRLTEQVERLADHAFKAEEWTSAAVYLRQAGTKAVTRSAHREAAACFDHALAALSHLPETRETIELGVDVRLDLRSAFFPLGGLEGIGEHLREAERLARMLDDPRRLGWVSAQRANYLWQTGHPIEARAPAEHAYALAQRLGDLPLRAAASFFLSEVCVSAGDYRRAEALCEEITRSPESATVGAAWPLWWVLAWASTERGRFAEAMAHGEEGLRRAEAAHHEFIRIITSCGIAEVHARRGQLAEALRMGERARALAIDADLPGVAPIVARCLGHVYALSGRIVEGRALLDEALQGAERLGRRAVLSRLLTYLGEASLLAEQPDEAFLWAERALALTRERGERGHEAWALRLLGDIARHRDAHVLAEAHYREAAALATELGMLPLLAHCHLGLGTVYGRMDRRQQAVGDLATASRMYGEMGMRSWQQRASAELATMQSGSRDRA
jgi:tetratricopeptide (TPR) repeat protein